MFFRNTLPTKNRMLTCFNKRILGLFLVGLCMVCALNSCNRKKQIYTPKPLAYFRIDLPEHHYQRFDTILPFSFERATNSTVTIKPQQNGTCWMDVDYPELNATFKFTYFSIPCADSLRSLIVKEERMVKFHYQKADDVEYSIIKDPEARLWGQIYDVEGKEVATPFQVWMTDSLHHFLRGTLYFNFTPNNDSLQPVIEYLRADAMHLIETFQWK